jgi:protein O-mannosyl-transferase
MPSSSDTCTDSLRSQHIAYAGLLCVLTLASYSRVFSCGFIDSYDDELYITLNPFVSQGITVEGLRWSLTNFVSGNWHPLTWWSHMIDVALFGMNPIGHHAVNLLMHAVNAVLLYAFFFRVTGFRARSFLVAALFSLHPLHVESVAWVAERKDVLSSLFALAALHVYTSYIHSPRKAHYLALAILLCLSLMAKPMMVTLPFLLLVLDYWPLERKRHQSLLRLFQEKIFLVIPVVVISLITLVAQKSAGALKPLDSNSVPARLFNALDAYVVYLRKFFSPHDLASFYPYTSVSSIRIIVAVMVLGTISFLVWRYHQQRPWLLAGWLWFLGMLVPVIGIVRVGEQAYADRYMYLPIIGVIVMVVWGGAELLGRFDLTGYGKKATAAVVIAACALLTWTQTGYWKDSYSLYSRELAVTKGNWHAHFGLGNVLASRQNYDEAIHHYYAVLNAKPLSVDTHNNLGASLRSLGRSQEALEHFLQAVKINPNYLNAYYNLALALADLGDTEAARRYLQTALVIDPSFQEARRYLEYLESRGGPGSYSTLQ